MNFEFIVFGLATWRIASLLVQEDGPWNIFVRIRELVGIEHDQNGVPYLVPENFFAGVLSCVWCCSIWIAFVWLILCILLPTFTLKIATAFSFSTVAIIIDKYLHA